MGDTSEAIADYSNHSSDERGRNYFVTYGVLHALYLQQDAAFWLCKSLNIQPVASFKTPGRWARTIPALAAAREARNNSIGHPVRRDVGGPLASFFLVQSSLGAEGFQLIEAEGGNRRFIYINVHQLVEGQLAVVAILLDDAARQLQQADIVHKRQFMDEKLVTTFERLQYSVSKLGAITDSDQRLMMPHDVNHIREGLARFRAALATRGEPFETDLEWSYAMLHRALKVLDDHVLGTAYADPDLAEVAARFVYYELEHLRAYAQAVDDDYVEAKPDVTPSSSSA